MCDFPRRFLTCLCDFLQSCSLCHDKLSQILFSVDADCIAIASNVSLD